MQNIKLGIRELGWDIDRKKFYIYLMDHYHLDEIGIYVGFMIEKTNEYKELREMGYRLYFKSTHEW